MPEKPVITRFAPSPTGALHVGGARTALLNWAFARHHGGQFILRIEDTDVARSTPEATRGIIADLRWLGLDWDQGPAAPDNVAAALSTSYDPYAQQTGDAGPYFQSQRAELYRKYLKRLQAAGRVYEDEGALRFRMPAGPITVPDLVLGDVTVEPGQVQLEDFIIFKGEAAGGGPTFHFANVVDDAEMGVTHVIRGQEHLNNTVKHLALYEALNLAPPSYAHIPLIFNPDGSKMSKRDKAKAARQGATQWLDAHGGDTAALLELAHEHGLQTDEPSDFASFLDKQSDDLDTAVALAKALGVSLPEIDVADFRDSGYLPEVMVNYLALLGWNPGGDVEKFGSAPLSFLTEKFTLDRVQKAHARFDRDKLFRFNADAIPELPLNEFADRLARYGAEHQPEAIEKLGDASSASFRSFAEAYQPRARTLGEPFEIGGFFFAEDTSLEYDPKAIKKALHKGGGDGLAALRELRPRVEAIEPFEPEPIHDFIKQFAEDTGRGMGKVAQPLRVAVSGGMVSPPIDQTLALLGKASVLARIDHCLNVVPEPEQG
ncbi:MAG: glutamate--tRNA ligase [Phycisphaeraceae bacterium]